MILLHRNAILWLYTALSGREPLLESAGDQTPSPSAAQDARSFLRSNSWHWDGPQHYHLIQDILDLIQAADQDARATQQQTEHDRAVQDLLDLTKRLTQGDHHVPTILPATT